MRATQAATSLRVSGTPGSGPGPEVQATHFTVPNVATDLKAGAMYWRAASQPPQGASQGFCWRAEPPRLISRAASSMPHGGATGCLRMCSALGQDSYPPRGFLSGPAAPLPPAVFRSTGHRYESAAHTQHPRPCGQMSGKHHIS